MSVQFQRADNVTKYRGIVILFLETAHHLFTCAAWWTSKAYLRIQHVNRHQQHPQRPDERDDELRGQPT